MQTLKFLIKGVRVDINNNKYFRNKYWKHFLFNAYPPTYGNVYFRISDEFLYYNIYLMPRKMKRKWNFETIQGHKLRQHEENCLQMTIECKQKVQILARCQRKAVPLVFA